MFPYIIIGVIIFTLLWLKWRFSYWSRVGLEVYQTGFMDSLGEKVNDGYFSFKKKGLKHGGTFLFFKPIYIPVDQELLRNMLQSDFDHFVNRKELEHLPPLINNLVNMRDNEWRTWRSRLTPTFTTGKMKMMFQTMVERGIMLGDVFKEQAVINEPVNTKDVFSRFTTDVIGSTVFGIECNSLKNPNSEFRIFAKKFLERIKMFQLLREIPTPLLKLFGIKLIPEDLESFFINAIKDTVDYRESNNIFRKDFLHLLLQLKNKGIISHDNDENVLGDKNKTGNHVSLEQIAAQCLVFFNAGYETSATTITFAMVELAQNQELQDKLRKNIRDVLKKHGGELSYESIMEMEYLDQVVYETLRKHPPIQAFPRMCNKDYPVAGTDFVIKSGQQIFLPFRAIHHDPDLWPEPEKFDPERFNKENKPNIPKYAFMPFGEGPRMCIGARFGLLQSKTGLALAIKDFKFTLSDKTSRPIEFDYRSFISDLKEILWLNVEKVE